MKRGFILVFLLACFLQVAGQSTGKYQIKFLEVNKKNSDYGVAILDENKLIFTSADHKVTTAKKNYNPRKDLYKVMSKGKSAINDGISLVFFPEATTTDGKQIKSFHPSIYQTAIDMHCTTQAVAICYPEKDNKASAAPYIDNDNFVYHLFRILKKPGIDVQLHYCSPIPTTYNHDRKDLALSTHNQVSKVLAL